MVAQVIGFCQFHSSIFFIFSLLFITLGLTGCSSSPKIEENAPSDLESLDLQAKTASKSDIGPFWFTGAERFRFYDQQGQFVIHPFFDYESTDLQKEDSLLFYPLIPENSPYAYEFDLSSGHQYKVFNYCPQKDVWGKYTDKIYLPPFTEGIIPRVLDEQGKPQRVIVFGNGAFYRSVPDDQIKEPLSKVRLIGSTYEQFCRNYPCLGQESWTSRLILIAVDDRDEEFRGVASFESLKMKVDWAYVKAFLQNSRGRTLHAAGDYPSFRILGELDISKTRDLISKKGHTFSQVELKKLRKNCEGLYDSIYTSVLKLRERLARESISDLKINDNKFMFWSEQSFKGDDYIKGMSNLSPISQRNVWKVGDELLEDLKDKEEKLKKEKDEELQRLALTKSKKGEVANYMKIFFSKYLNPYATCERYVRPANLNENDDRHWFFTHLSAVTQVMRLGYYYNCPKRAWLENLVGIDGKYLNDPLKQLDRCSNYDIDPAFTQAVNLLVNRSKNDQEHYSYIEYDNGEGGSHQNIQSWTYFSGKNLSCIEKQNKYLVLQSDKERTLFPDDVRWIPFIPQTKKDNGNGQH